MITQFWEGDIPLRPLVFGLQDEYGNDIGGVGQFRVSVRMLDTDNKEANLKGSQLVTSPNSPYATFTFPQDRSVFKKHGDYLIQLSMKDDAGREQWTSGHTIRVKKLGKRGNY